MTEYTIKKLSRDAAILAACHDSRVFQLDLDSFERIRDIRFSALADIIGVEHKHTVLYFIVSPCEDPDDRADREDPND